MGLVPRTNTPADFTRRLYIIAATGLIAAISIVSIVYTSIFYAKFHDDIIFEAISQIKPLLITALTVESVLVAIFVVELVLFIVCPIEASAGWYILMMIIITEVLILCTFICYAIFCSQYTKNKKDYEGKQIPSIISSMKNLSILMLICWSISIVIFIWVTFIYVKLYECE